jgi:hypothetical protein
MREMPSQGRIRLVLRFSPQKECGRVLLRPRTIDAIEKPSLRCLEAGRLLFIETMRRRLAVFAANLRRGWCLFF